MTFAVYDKDHGLLAGGFLKAREAVAYAKRNGSSYWIVRVTSKAIAVRDGEQFVATNRIKEDFA